MAGDDHSQLRDEIARLLAQALESDDRHVKELDRRDDLHIREVDRRDSMHIDEIQRRLERHDDELRNITIALQNRDLIGQAKGVLIVSLGVSADRAFELIKSQSQHENRKVVEIAAEIVDRASRRPGPRSAPPPAAIG